MAKTLRKYFVPACLAILVHLVIFSLFFVNFKSKPKPIQPVVQPEVIQATSLDESKVIEEVKQLQKIEQNKRLAEQKRQHQLEQQRIAEQKRINQLEQRRKQQLERIQQARHEQQKIDQAKKQEAEKLAKLKQQQEKEKQRLAVIAEKKKKLEEQRKKEQQRLAALEKKRKEELKRKTQERIKREKAAKLAAKKKAEKQARLKAEAEARNKREAELAAAEAVRQGKIVNNATRTIMRKVERKWIRPPGTESGLTATIRVRVIPGGSVKDATVVKSSGNSGFDRSAELAVRKASPLPVPSDPEIFNQFRSFTFNFSPS